MTQRLSLKALPLVGIFELTGCTAIAGWRPGQAPYPLLSAVGWLWLKARRPRGKAQNRAERVRNLPAVLAFLLTCSRALGSRHIVRGLHECYRSWVNLQAALSLLMRPVGRRAAAGIAGHGALRVNQA